MSSTRTPSTRNASIDWIRVVSIFYITGFWHLFGYTSAWHPNHEPLFFRVTVVALALFTLISGYLLARAPVTLSAGGLGSFWFKRLVRIYPPYLAALLVFAALHQLGAPLLNAALLISMFTPPPPFTLWFITMIMLFYVMAPFLIAALSRPLWFTAGTITLWLGLLALWHLKAVPDVRVILYFPAFVIGMVLARHPLPSGRLMFLTGIVAIALAYWASLRASGPTADQSIWDAPLAIVASPLIFSWINQRLPSSGLIEKLSAGSFFLYLFHRPVYFVLLKACHVPDTWIRVPFLLLVAFPAAIFAGIAGQKIYDWLLSRANTARIIKTF